MTKQIPNIEMVSEKQQQLIKTHPQKTKTKNLLTTAKAFEDYIKSNFY